MAQPQGVDGGEVREVPCDVAWRFVRLMEVRLEVAPTTRGAEVAWGSARACQRRSRSGVRCVPAPLL